jgi:hypothetical protein
MKKNLLLLLLISNLVMSSQTPRLCLYEIFTGETCPPTAATNPALNALLAQPNNTANMVSINWEVPIPYAPTHTWSLYQTNKTEIDWRWKSVPSGGYGYPISQSPMGLIDGQSQTVFGATGIHTGLMNSTVIATAQSYTSAFSVTMSRAWNANYTAVDLTVSIVATANFTSTGALVFRTCMIERNVDFSVAPGSTGEKHFEHVVIKSFPTLQNGISMVNTWVNGQSQTFTLNCPLPSYVRDKSEIEFVGFIQDDGNRKVAQAVRSGPGPLPDDIKMLAILAPTLSCSSSAYSPTVLIKNTGYNAISSLAIYPYINNVPVGAVPCSGVLNPGDSAWIPINTYSAAPLTAGNNTIYANVSLNNDQNFSNNHKTSFFNVPFPILSVKADAPGYCKGAMVTLTATGAHSYTWNGFPTWGNSFSFSALQSGPFVVVGTNTLTNCSKTVTLNLVVINCTDIKNYSANDFRVFPNPVSDLLSIKIERSDEVINYKIIDQLGKEVASGKLEEETTLMNVSGFPAGLYVIVIGERRIKIVKNE